MELSALLKEEVMAKVKLNNAILSVKSELIVARTKIQAKISVKYRPFLVWYRKEK